MRTLGPREPWPDHPKPWWRETLALARQRGWTLQLVSGHTWGKIGCPGGCQIVIFSTGRQGESAAKTARRKVQRCLHGESSVLAKALGHLDDAERLTAAAAQLFERQVCHADVEEMLALASDALAAAEEHELLRRIDELPENGHGEPDAVLDDAERHLGLATVGLSGLPSEVAKPHRHRARACRARIDELRIALAERPTNVIPLRPLNDEKRFK